MKKFITHANKAAGITITWHTSVALCVLETHLFGVRRSKA